MSNTELCKLDDLPDNDAKGIVAVVEEKQRNIFVARKGEQVFAYINWCPHNQVLIDQIPNKFFNADKTFIQCSKHGAMFQVEDGLCVEGPCEGESLKALKTTIEDGVVYLVDA